MPREHRQRGRRAEAQKRKHDAAAADEASPKRRRLSDADENDERHQPWFPADHENDELAQMYEDDAADDDGPDDSPFFGLLDEEEQEYFRRADDMLEANQFSDPEERELFVQNLFKEADGKELKMACSQSCSRLMERLIKSASRNQLKTLFSKFSGHFLHLVQHRFASHCCETLFIQAAPVVSQEILESTTSQDQPQSDGESLSSMEDLYLESIKELDGNLGFLATNKFGSHALRVLLVVLAGEPLDSSNYRSLLQSRQKENIQINDRDTENSKDATLGKRAVPESFVATLGKLITGSVDGLDTHFLRTLSTHKIGNPTLQLLLQLELTSLGKQRAKDSDSIVRRLLPDDPLVDGTPSAAFANSLMYDPIGSRLLECILYNVPSKMFKTIYKNLWENRLGQLSRNEVASYVVGRILQRLSGEDLEVAMQDILPQIPNLISQSRYTLIKTLVERCSIRGVSTVPLADKLRNLVTEDAGKTLSLPKLLELPPQILTPTDSAHDGSTSAPAPAHPPAAPVSSSPAKTSAQRHASLLAQSLASVTPPLCTLLFDSVSQLPPSTCLMLANSTMHSQILQASLRSPHADLVFRRKLITRFYGRVGELAVHPAGSHFVDAIWDGGTMGMAFVRERLAEELAENEKELRESPYGRKVWRNWRMDLYMNQRDKWARQMRAEVGNDGFQSFPGGVEGVELQQFGPLKSGTPETTAGTSEHTLRSKKTPLQLARERYAAKQAKSSTDTLSGGSYTERQSNMTPKTATRSSSSSRDKVNSQDGANKGDGKD